MLSANMLELGTRPLLSSPSSLFLTPEWQVSCWLGRGLCGDTHLSSMPRASVSAHVVSAVPPADVGAASQLSPCATDPLVSALCSRLAAARHMPLAGSRRLARALPGWQPAAAVNGS